MEQPKNEVTPETGVDLRERIENQEESPKVLFSWFSNIAKLRDFVRTREAVRTGQPLWDLSATELAERKFMGGWTFNAYESVIATVPYFVLRGLLAISVSTRPSSAEVVAEFDAGARVGELLTATLSPLLFPLALMLTATVAGRRSMKRTAVDLDQARRARRAYLYFDGAYGLIPQAAIVFVIYALTDFSQYFEDLPGAVAVFLLLVFIYASVHETYLSLYWIPKGLFALHGYRTEYPKSFRWIRMLPKPVDPAPWSRYQMGVLFTVPILLLLLVIAFTLAITLVATSWAIVHHFLFDGGTLRLID